ncbi:interleukin-4 receptor subunit alpha [Eucyclogobius newberryi]|uniref:interleukin-4 receptor subunit alpha n=1 Tax=Eucyclogobius newberryi TaxID=166745 RepID=UPI003B5C9EF6
MKQILDMFFRVLIIAEILLFETSGFKLLCTNNQNTSISCHIDTTHYAEVKVKLTLNETESFETWTCAFDPCVGGCCCEIDVTPIMLLDNIFLAEIYVGEQRVHSQTINALKTFKPPNPFIISVDKINESYQVKWRTNTERALREDLWAVVTFQKKGDKPKKSEILRMSTVEDINYYEILGQDLEPGTTYAVSVKTYTRYNVSSDSSKEVEFTTARNGVIIAVILSLCVVSIVVSAVLFAAFIKLKGKLWDNAVKVEKPKLLNIKPKKQMILTSESLLVHSFSVEPLVPRKSLTSSKESLSNSCGGSGQTSGMSSASSSPEYANTEPLDIDIEAVVMEAIQNDLRMFTPSMHAPGSGEPKPNWVFFPSETTAVPLVFENTCYMTQSPKMTCDVGRPVASDSSYHSSDAPRIQDLLIPPHVSTIETDMSYQPCPQSEEASNAAGSHIFLPVVYGFQDFERQSNNVLSGHNSECPSLITGFTNILQTSDMGQFQVGIPQVSDEIIVDSGYHSV